MARSFRRWRKTRSELNPSKKMKSSLSSLLSAFVLVSATSASGGVTALNQLIKGTESWTVPAGKTLILTHAARTGSDFDLALRIFVNGASDSEFVQLSATGVLKGASTPLPIYLAEGARIHNPTSHTALIIGRLADNADLFACVPSDSRLVTADKTRVVAEVTAKSARPAKLVVEDSDNLTDWNEVDSTETKIGPSRRRFEVTGNGEVRRFVRAKLVARPND